MSNLPARPNFAQLAESIQKGDNLKSQIIKDRLVDTQAFDVFKRTELYSGFMETLRVAKKMVDEVDELIKKKMSKIKILESKIKKSEKRKKPDMVLDTKMEIFLDDLIKLEGLRDKKMKTYLSLLQQLGFKESISVPTGDGVTPVDPMSKMLDVMQSMALKPEPNININTTKEEKVYETVNVDVKEDELSKFLSGIN